MTDIIDVYLPSPPPPPPLDMRTGHLSAAEEDMAIEASLVITEGPPGLYEVVPEPLQDTENPGLFAGLYLPFEDGLLEEDPPASHLYFHPAL